MTDIQAIYAETDRVIATTLPRCAVTGAACRGDCCRFTHGQPLLTPVEASYLLADKPPLMRPVSNDACAFLTDDGRCSVYDKRPMACRIFYCDPDPVSLQRNAEWKANYAAAFRSSGERHAPLNDYLRERYVESDAPARTALPVI